MLGRCESHVHVLYTTLNTTTAVTDYMYLHLHAMCTVYMYMVVKKILTMQYGMCPLPYEMCDLLLKIKVSDQQELHHLFTMHGMSLYFESRYLRIRKFSGKKSMYLS